MSRHHPLLTPVFLLLALLVASPAPAHAQLGDLIRETAQDQFEKEVQALVRNAVRCVFDDLECIESAKADGEEVVLTDEEGELITDEEGRPVQTQEDLPADKRAEAAAAVTTAERGLYAALEAEGRVAVDDILFATDAATILPGSVGSLEAIAGMLREHADLQVLIEGHIDDRGDFRGDRELSEERAEAVRAWLTDGLGIAADRFEVVGVGSTRPVASNDTEEGREKNQRIEIVRIGG